MKKSRVNEILEYQTKRKNKIICISTILFILTIILLSLIIKIYNNNKIVYVDYNEDSKVDYNVFLNTNDFFDKEYLEKNNQYIASLINYIETNFNYKLEIDEENISYDYSYRIEAEVEVKDSKTKNTIYKHIDTLLDKISSHSNGGKIVHINETLKIDYGRYNNLISKFINTYELTDYIANLKVKLYVDVEGSCDKFAEKSNSESVTSLTIPLTTKTIAIDIESTMLDNKDSIMACRTNDRYNNLYIFMSIIMALIIITITAYLINYAIKTRTAESIYDKELKKILVNYRSYIQKINNNFDLEGYQVLKVDTFTDMLEIRDTIGEPILMLENKDKTGTFFLIPSKTKILYSYGIKVSDIRKNMNKNN